MLVGLCWCECVCVASAGVLGSVVGREVRVRCEWQLSVTRISVSGAAVGIVHVFVCVCVGGWLVGVCVCA